LVVLAKLIIYYRANDSVSRYFMDCREIDFNVVMDVTRPNVAYTVHGKECKKMFNVHQLGN